MKKKVLITGGDGDIAKAIINGFGGKYYVFNPNREILNVADINSVSNFFEENGSFDLIINNAGTIHPKRILDSQEDLWLRDVMVNLVGPYYVSKKGLELNKRTIVINIASTAAYAAYNDWSSYCSSKAALVTFTKCLASDEFSAFAIAPGAILTKFRDNLNLSNENAQTSQDVFKIIEEIILGLYKPGDVVFFRKDEKKIL